MTMNLFPFTRFFFFLLSLTRLLEDITIWVTLWVYYKKQELFTLREHLGSPRFLVGLVLLICYLSVCFFVICSSSFCLVSNVAPVSGLSIPCCLFGFISIKHIEKQSVNYIESPAVKYIEIQSAKHIENQKVKDIESQSVKHIEIQSVKHIECQSV